MSHTIHEDHDTHVHGVDCGHESVQHGDHVDYLHDGHAHFEHDGHFDECTVCDCAKGGPCKCENCQCANCSCENCKH